MKPIESDFSSPVVMVYVMEGSRCMCLVTINDKFLILVIDEILDELQGAIFLPSWIFILDMIKS